MPRQRLKKLPLAERQAIHDKILGADDKRKLSTVVGKQAPCLLMTHEWANGSLTAETNDGKFAMCAIGAINAAILGDDDPNENAINNMGHMKAEQIVHAAFDGKLNPEMPTADDEWLYEYNDNLPYETGSAEGRRRVVGRLRSLAKRLAARGL